MEVKKYQFPLVKLIIEAQRVYRETASSQAMIIVKCLHMPAT